MSTVPCTAVPSIFVQSLLSALHLAHDRRQTLRRACHGRQRGVALDNQVALHDLQLLRGQQPVKSLPFLRVTVPAAPRPAAAPGGQRSG